MLIPSMNPHSTSSHPATSHATTPVLGARWSQRVIGKGADYSYEYHHLLEAGPVAARFDGLHYKNPDNALVDAIRAARELSAGGRSAFGVFRMTGLGNFEVSPLSLRDRTVTRTTRYGSDIHEDTRYANRLEPLRLTVDAVSLLSRRTWGAEATSRGRLVAVVDGDSLLDTEQGHDGIRFRPRVAT